MILCNKRITKALIRLRRLICAYVVRPPPPPSKTGFLAPRPNHYSKFDTRSVIATEKRNLRSKQMTVTAVCET